MDMVGYPLVFWWFPIRIHLTASWLIEQESGMTRNQNTWNIPRILDMSWYVQLAVVAISRDSTARELWTLWVPPCPTNDGLSQEIRRRWGVHRIRRGQSRRCWCRYLHLAAAWQLRLEAGPSWAAQWNFASFWYENRTRKTHVRLVMVFSDG